MNRFQIEEAIRGIGRRYPEYLNVLSHIRIFKEVPDMLSQAGGPIGVDQYWRLYWDPNHKVDGVNAKLRMETLILHELGHLIGDDAERAIELMEGRSIVVQMLGKNPEDEKGPINQLAWNMAGDARINAHLRKLPWTKTDSLVFPETLKQEWDDRQTGVIEPPEWYYIEIRDSVFEEPQDGDGDCEGDEGEGGQGGGGGGIAIPGAEKHKGKGKGKGKPGDGDSSSGSSDEQGEQGQKPHSCGSVAHGQKRPWEEDADEDCLSKDEQRSIIDNVEREIGRKLAEGQTLKDQTSQTAGTDAAFPMLCDPEKVRNHYNHALWLDTIQRLLYKYLDHSRRTWRMPHRRIDGLPGKRRFPKQAAVVCDISGSINELSIIRTFEVLDRLFGRGFDIRLVACDTQAHEVSDRQARYSGGGTDMGEGIRFAAQRFPQAACVIVVTDGHSPWPEESPAKCPVIVLSWGAEGPQWAQNIPMPGLTDDAPVKPQWR